MSSDTCLRTPSASPSSRGHLAPSPLSSVIVHAGGLVVLMSMFGGLALAGALPGQGSGEDESGVVEIQDVETVGPPSWVGGLVGPLISVTVSVPQWA